MNTRTFSRRKLLQGATAAVAAPYMLTSAALGNADKAPASERITTGHIGAGNRGRDLLKGFLTCKYAQPVAVADVYRDRRESAAERMKGQGYTDFRQLLERKDIDAVVIATPDHWHVPMALMAARAGKNVYLEKPLGVSVEQDLACRKMFQDKKLIFQYGTQQRSMPHCRIGCELVRSGRIGPVEAIEVLAPPGFAGGSTEPAPVPDGLDYELWVGPAPMRPYTKDRCTVPGTYFIYDHSLGYVAGWGAHPLDILVWGCDADLSGPMVVEGTGEIPKEGLYDTMMKWDMRIQLGNVKVTFKVGEDTTRFIGPDGWVQIRRSGLDAHPKSLLKEKLGPNDVHLPRSGRHDENFIEAIRAQKPAISTIQDAVRSDVISHMCNIAVRTGRRITWDPKRETIVDDPAALKLLTRPMREPWKL